MPSYSTVRSFLQPVTNAITGYDALLIAYKIHGEKIGRGVDSGKSSLGFRERKRHYP